MKKELALALVFIASLLLLSIFSTAENTDCDYSERYDNDKDFIMNNKADCDKDYQYDCDDFDKDVYKDCKKTVWQRITSWLKGENRIKQKMDTANTITSNAIKKMIPEDLSKFMSTGRAKPEECAVTVCLNDNLKQIYCPLDYDECCGKYSSCRKIYCEDNLCDYDPDSYTDSYTVADDDEYDNTESSCTEEYHDCEDDGTEVICKGRFDDCDKSFSNCRCGTSDSVDYDTATPEIDTAEEVECDTGVYVCERQTITMSGDIAESKVTCKESFQRCSMAYGNCKCGDSSLTDFPTKKIGSDKITGTTAGTASYNCNYKGKDVPCYMMPSENCTKKKNTCDKGNGIMIGCEGSFSYCNTKYGGNCLCGVEMMTYS
ncbi:hypothetical protein ACFL3V_04685 [Nanoarchaeota archaeon]